MTARPPARLDAVPDLPPADLDYREAFRILSEAERTLAARGPAPAAILRRGHARFAIGDYLGAAFDAERVIRQDALDAEAQYLKGQAMLALAGLQAGITRPGVGAARRLPRRLPPSRHLLLTAQHCFRLALARNAHDAQAGKGLATAQALLRRLAVSTPGQGMRPGRPRPPRAA